MQRFLLTLLAACVFAPAAFAQQVPFTINDCSISSLSGSSQQLLAANPNRKYLMITNSSTTQTAYVNLAGGTAASAVSSLIIATTGGILTYTGGPGNTPPTNKITVTGTPGSPVTCYEGR